MTFPEYESSVEDGEPIQLFLFRYGTEAIETFAYTDHTEEIIVDHGGTVGEVTYTPVPIERDAIEATGTLDRSSLKVTVDVSTGLAELFRVYPPPYVVSLVIRQGHLADGNYVVTWPGRVIACARKGSIAELNCEPISTSMRRPGLRRHYQYGCPHVLYGEACGADKPSKTVAATVESVAGATVTLADGWEGAFLPAKFLGGLLEWTNATGSTERRTILRVTGDTLYLSGIPTGLEATDSANAVLGCNHKAFTAQGGDCEDLHGRLPSYGGQPWIPVLNPIGTYNNYY